MQFGEQLKQQRLKHIVSSYRLDGNESEAFNCALELLLDRYPLPLIELALVETLIDSWLRVPLLRGCKFLDKAQSKLQDWERLATHPDACVQPYVSAISPKQFHQITGLDPSPIFGTDFSLLRPPVRS